MAQEKVLNPDAVREDVMAYVQMVIALDSDHWEPGNIWKFRDDQTGEIKSLKVDERYIDKVEARLGLATRLSKELFREKNIIHEYVFRISFCDPHYDFMDNEALVKAVIAVRAE